MDGDSLIRELVDSMEHKITCILFKIQPASTGASKDIKEWLNSNATVNLPQFHARSHYTPQCQVSSAIDSIGRKNIQHKRRIPKTPK